MGKLLWEKNWKPSFFFSEFSVVQGAEYWKSGWSLASVLALSMELMLMLVVGWWQVVTASQLLHVGVLLLLSAWGVVQVIFHQPHHLGGSRTDHGFLLSLNLVSLRLEDWQGCDLSWVLLFWLGLGRLLLPLSVRGSRVWCLLFLQVVDEVATGAVGTEPGAVVGLTQIRLVLGVSGDVPEFCESVSKLALVSVFAGPVLLEGSAQLCLVSAWVDGHSPSRIAGFAASRWGTRGRRGGGRGDGTW
jgi:hypothetical protein